MPFSCISNYFFSFLIMSEGNRTLFHLYMPIPYERIQDKIYKRSAWKITKQVVELQLLETNRATLLFWKMITLSSLGLSCHLTWSYMLTLQFRVFYTLIIAYQTIVHCLLQIWGLGCSNDLRFRILNNLFMVYQTPSNSLIIRRKIITTAKEVWILGLN